MTMGEMEITATQGEVFNDYSQTIAYGIEAHAEGLFNGYYATHAEGETYKTAVKDDAKKGGDNH